MTDMMGWNIMSDMRLAIYYFAEVTAGMVLNVLMVISGVGLLGLAEWGRRLAIGVAWLKIVRWVAMVVVTMVVIVPITTEKTTKGLQQIQAQAKAKSGGRPCAISDGGLRPVRRRSCRAVTSCSVPPRGVDLPGALALVSDSPSHPCGLLAQARSRSTDHRIGTGRCVREPGDARCLVTWPARSAAAHSRGLADRRPHAGGCWCWRRSSCCLLWIWWLSYSLATRACFTGLHSGDRSATAATILLTIVVVQAPAVLAGSLAGERERGVLQLLLTTAVSPREIVSGRLLGKLSQVGMIVLAGLPILALLAAWNGLSFSSWRRSFCSWARWAWAAAGWPSARRSSRGGGATHCSASIS